MYSSSYISSNTRNEGHLQQQLSASVYVHRASLAQQSLQALFTIRQFFSAYPALHLSLYFMVPDYTEHM